MRDRVRIANAGGYWGDDPEALQRQVLGGDIDYVTMDFLAEITMVILQRQRAQNPQAGFAADFVAQLRGVLGAIASKGVTVIVNAGGINPQACADAVGELCRSQGVDLPIGVVAGDDILGRLDEIEAAGADLANLDDRRPYETIRGRVVAANAYLGARPVVDALKQGARIIVTGRTTDAALILAPLVHEFGWGWSDWDRLAAGTVAGHILECGAQATGGNFTDWEETPSMLDMGYPIVEASADGEFVVTKHPGTGGVVNRKTVTEQLLYEIGDPRAYLTPDVAVDFTSVELSDDGADRVRVRCCRGRRAPEALKASIVYSDGFKAVGTALLSGPNVLAKARRFSEMIWHRLGSDFADRRTDFIGANACWGEAAPAVEPNEIIFRLAVRDADRKKLQRFASNILGFGLQAPPGFGVFGGRPDVQTAFGFWPALVPRRAVSATVEVRRGDEVWKGACPMSLGDLRGDGGQAATAGAGLAAAVPAGPKRRLPLHAVAYARSGDKGDHANIGVAARSAAIYQFLRAEFTEERVKRHYADLVRGSVVRYELPNLLAFNFMLHNALGGGGTLSLRVDHQGKTLAQGLLLMELEVPEALLAGLPERPTKR